MILTKSGYIYLANEAAAGRALSFTHMAFGVIPDDVYAALQHTGNEAALFSEIARVPVNSAMIDPLDNTVVKVDAIVNSSNVEYMPPEGLYIREAAIYSGDILVAIGKWPSTWLCSGSNFPDAVYAAIHAVVRLKFGYGNLLVNGVTSESLVSYYHLENNYIHALDIVAAQAQTNKMILDLSEQIGLRR